MLKLRLQGTKNEIRWFLKILNRDSKIQLENTSKFFDNKGTEKYKRLYTEVYRLKKGSQKVTRIIDTADNSAKDNYCGSGKRFS